MSQVRATLDSLDDPEERSLLADNALEEASGRENEVASDPACSRVLEVLLGAASGDAVLNFAKAVLTGDKLLALATKYVTHSLQKQAYNHMTCIWQHMDYKMQSSTRTG